MISFYAIPDDNSVSNVFSSLGASVTGVITEGGAASQLNGVWIGSLSSIFPDKGYWVIASSEANLSLTQLDAKFTDPNSEYSAVIPIFITRALDQRDLIIYGSGKQRRDFIYVSDVANAVLTFAKNNINGVFNIGTNQDYSLIELANIILKNTKSNSKIVFDDERLGDVMFSTADLKKQNDIGGWAPKIAFDDGLQKTINYYSNNS